MSTKEARKLLGKEAQGMDDDQILEVIVLLTEAAKEYLHNTMLKKQGTD